MKDLTKVYGSGEKQVQALNGISFSVENGEFCTIVGTSGSGESTLLHILGGVDTPTGGTVTADGEDLNRMSEKEKRFTEGKRLRSFISSSTCSLGSMRQTVEKRKREFAVYQSLGIGRGNMRTILAIEFTFFTVYAILFTVIGSFAANYGITQVIRLIGDDKLPVFYPYRVLFLFVAFDIAVGIGMYLYSLVYMKRISVIDTIRQY